MEAKRLAAVARREARSSAREAAAAAIQRSQAHRVYPQDSQGGFLLEPEAPVDEAESQLHAEPEEPALEVSEKTGNILYKRCIDCGKDFVLSSLLKEFGVAACNECRAEFKDSKYAFVTKSDAKKVRVFRPRGGEMNAVQAFLLADDELEPHDEGAPGLRCIERRNPLNEHWGRMKLFLRSQVEAAAHARFGGAQGLADELERREALSRKRKQDRSAEQIRKACSIAATRS